MPARQASAVRKLTGQWATSHPPSSQKRWQFLFHNGDSKDAPHQHHQLNGLSLWHSLDLASCQLLSNGSDMTTAPQRPWWSSSDLDGASSKFKAMQGPARAFCKNLWTRSIQTTPTSHVLSTASCATATPCATQLQCSAAAWKSSQPAIFVRKRHQLRNSRTNYSHYVCKLTSNKFSQTHLLPISRSGLSRYFPCPLHWFAPQLFVKVLVKQRQHGDIVVLKIIVSFASVRQSLQGGVEEVAQVLGGIFALTPNKCLFLVSRFIFPCFFKKYNI